MGLIPPAVKSTGLTLLPLLYSIYILRTNFYDIHPIHGPSMAPLLSPDYLTTSAKDVVLFKKSILVSDDYKDLGGNGVASELKRGMVVSFLSPMTGTLAVKRVVALGGDRVKPLGVHNVSARAREQGLLLGVREEEEVTVPFGHVWVEGDQVDREKTLDSNSYGPISKSLIQGLAVRILWPPSRIGVLDWENDWEKKTRDRITRIRDEHALPEEWKLY